MRAPTRPDVRSSLARANARRGPDKRVARAVSFCRAGLSRASRLKISIERQGAVAELNVAHEGQARESPNEKEGVSLGCLHDRGRTVRRQEESCQWCGESRSALLSCAKFKHMLTNSVSDLKSECIKGFIWMTRDASALHSGVRSKRPADIVRYVATTAFSG